MLPCGTESVKFPSRSVMVALFVPFCLTVAPIIVSLPSVTFPVIFLACCVMAYTAFPPAAHTCGECPSIVSVRHPINNVVLLLFISIDVRIRLFDISYCQSPKFTASGNLFAIGLMLIGRQNSLFLRYFHLLFRYNSR